MFPASCPFVTATGSVENFGPEVATSAAGPGGFFSGGGFSLLYEAPAYQIEDTTRYVRGLKGQYKGLYNPRGRGYPDVSAQGFAEHPILWASVG